MPDENDTIKSHSAGEIKEEKNNFFNKYPRVAGLTVSLCMIFVILVIWETALKEVRWTGERPFIRLMLHLPNRDLIVKPTNNNLGLTNGVIGGPSRFRTDQNGFLGPAGYPNPDLKILFLGGSTTECLYVQEENRFPRAVATSLSKRLEKKVNAYNGGVSGNHSLHSINTLLNVGLAVNPEYVVLMHNSNDLSTLIHSSSYWNTSRPLVDKVGKYEVLKYIKDKTFPSVYDQLRPGMITIKNVFYGGNEDEFSEYRGRAFHGDISSMRQSFEGNLNIYVEICLQRKAKPVLMTQPNRYTMKPSPQVANEAKVLDDIGITYAEWRAMYLEFNEVIRNVAEKNDKVILIDLDKEIPKTSEYMYDSIHLTDKGSLAIAKIITGRFLRLHK